MVGSSAASRAPLVRDSRVIAPNVTFAQQLRDLMHLPFHLDGTQIFRQLFVRCPANFAQIERVTSFGTPYRRAVDWEDSV